MGQKVSRDPDLGLCSSSFQETGLCEQPLTGQTEAPTVGAPRGGGGVAMGSHLGGATGRLSGRPTMRGRSLPWGLCPGGVCRWGESGCWGESATWGLRHGESHWGSLLGMPHCQGELILGVPAWGSTVGSLPLGGSLSGGSCLRGSLAVGVPPREGRGCGGRVAECPPPECPGPGPRFASASGLSAGPQPSAS